MPEIFWMEGKAKIIKFIPDLYVLLWDEAQVCEGSFSYVSNYYQLEFYDADN